MSDEPIPSRARARERHDPAFAALVERRRRDAQSESADEADVSRLTAFLYVLLRDHLPAGVVARLVGELAECESFEFSTRELAALAASYADTLLT